MSTEAMNASDAEHIDLDALVKEAYDTVLKLDPTKFAVIEMNDTDTGEFQGYGLMRPGEDEGPLVISFDMRIIDACLASLVLLYTAACSNIAESMSSDPMSVN